MDIEDIVCLVCGSISIIIGILGLFNVKFFYNHMKKMYTEESLEKYYKKNIISDFIFGIGLLREFFSNNKVIYYCGYFLAFIGAITIFINTNKLQKKDE